MDGPDQPPQFSMGSGGGGGSFHQSRNRGHYHRGGGGGRSYRGGRGGGPRNRGGGGGPRRYNFSSSSSHPSQQASANNNFPPRSSYNRHHPHSGPPTSAAPVARGNRFHPESLLSRSSGGRSYQPPTALQKNLQDMLYQVGAISSSTAPTTTSSNENHNHNETTLAPPHSSRPEVRGQVERIQALTAVLCGDKADWFLQHQKITPSIPVDAAAVVGPLATSLIHAVAVLPGQTPCYAALTWSLQQHSPAQSPHAAGGVGQRCVDFAVATFCRDVDALLLTPSSSSHLQEGSGPASVADLARTVVRLRLTLRYLALLAVHLPVVVTRRPEGEEAVPAATTHQPLSLAGLLQALIQAAQLAAVGGHRRAGPHPPTAALLAALVWSTIPYLLNTPAADPNTTTTLADHHEEEEERPSVPITRAWIVEHLIQPMESFMQESYRSTFAPGWGSTALLLRDEQLEEKVGGHDEQDEDEDDDEDEEDDDDLNQTSGQVCDSLQDLWRTVRFYLNQGENPPTAQISRWALFHDTPWKELSFPGQDPRGQYDSTHMDDDQPAPRSQPRFSGKPLYLRVFPTCKSLTLLLGGDVGSQETLHWAYSKDLLRATIVGRLPIFGPPAETIDPEDEEEDMAEQASSIKNENLEAYQKEFGLMDRYFVAESIRDILLSFESSVSEYGVERGSVKMVAEQLWVLSRMMIRHENNGSTTTESKGIEYCLVETILSLMVQSDYATPLGWVYLARVLLELVRIEPTLVSPAVALAVSNLMQDYMPSLVPTSRYRLSQWFAFHLTNTNYQWPVAFWKHWEPFVRVGWPNSRGGFVRATLNLFMENVNIPQLLVADGLSREVDLLQYWAEDFKRQSASDSDPEALASLEADLTNRIWGTEAPESILAYLLSDEVSETVGAGEMETESTSWWRTRVVIQCIISNCQKEYEFLLTQIEKSGKASSEGTAMQEDEDEFGSDSLSMTIDMIVRYKPVLLGVMDRDAAAMEEIRTLQGTKDTGKNDIRTVGEITMLHELGRGITHSRAVLEGCVQTLLSQRIVASESVVKWSLGDRDTVTDRVVCLRWWEFATSAIRFGLDLTLAESQDLSKQAMDDDGLVDMSPERTLMRDCVDYLDKVLTYCAQRVFKQLLCTESGSSKGKKMPPLQVDLVEGFKYVVLDCYQAYFQSLRHKCRESDLQLYLAESAIAGPKLASSLQRSDAFAVHELRRALERM